MRDVMRDDDLTYNMVMRDAKSIWGVYNTLYAPNFYASRRPWKSMRDVRDFFAWSSRLSTIFRILLGWGVTRHAVTILAKKNSAIFWEKFSKNIFFRFSKNIVARNLTNTVNSLTFFTIYDFVKMFIKKFYKFLFFI